jgi:hypothetical protein
MPCSDQRTVTWTKWLACVSVTLWLIALALPGFIVNTQKEAWFGWAILPTGLAFAWMVNGWAVYANIPFLIAATRLLSGRQARTAALSMAGLVATLPLFEGVLVDNFYQQPSPVVSWGWGACLWLAAVTLMALASALRSAIVNLPAAILILLAGAVGFGFLVNYRLSQYSQANDQERLLYLPPTMAFTRASLCGVPLTVVAAPALPPETIVSLERGTSQGSRPSLWIPSLRHYQDEHSAWTTLADSRFSNVQVKVRMPKRPDRPVLRAQETEHGAILQLLASPAGPALYEQRLKFQPVVPGGEARYCPMSTKPDATRLHIGYDTHLSRALGQSLMLAPHKRLRDEVASVACSLGTNDLEGIRGLRSWDGRQVVLEPESMRSYAGFCSSSYIVLTDLRNSPVTGAPASPTVHVFDRSTLRPLALFNDKGACVQQTCDATLRDGVISALVTDTHVMLEMRSDDLVSRWTLQRAP